jgi:hypothetical protein
VVVIDHKVVAAALRRPAEVSGTGHHTVRELIDAQSRRRASATGGESRIPVDDVTEATVADAGWSFDDVLPEGVRLRVRRTANLHQGGTIHDVTAEVNPELCLVASTAADAIGMPVTGIDLRSRTWQGPIRVHRGQRSAWPGQPRATAQTAQRSRYFPERESRPSPRRGHRKNRPMQLRYSARWIRSRTPAAEASDVDRWLTPAPRPVDDAVNNSRLRSCSATTRSSMVPWDAVDGGDGARLAQSRADQYLSLGGRTPPRVADEQYPSSEVQAEATGRG